MYNPSSPLTVQRAGLLLSSLGSPPAHRVLAKCRPWTLQDGPMLRDPCQPSQREGELGSQRLSRAQQLGAQRQCRGLFGCHGRVCTRPVKATRTLMLCYTKVESCVAFVECEFAWCEFGVMLSCVFEVCVSSAIAPPHNPPPRRLAPSPGYCGWLLCE